MTIDDVTDDLAVIGIWGPEARAALAAVTRRRRLGGRLPVPHRDAGRVGGAAVLAQRITYVGELGYELYVPPAQAVHVWDALVAAALARAGRLRGARLAPDREGLPLLRQPTSPSGDTPFEAGLGFCVAKGKRPGLDRSPRERLRTLLVGGTGYLTLYGGEAVQRDGESIGRVRSAAYGFTVRRNVALARLPAELSEGAGVEVDVLGELVPAVVAPDALYDPQNERITR